MPNALELFHTACVVALISLPYIASAAWVHTTGVYVALFMMGAISLWVVNNGHCWMNSFEANDCPHGTMAHVVQSVFRLRGQYGFTISLVADMLYCLSAFWPAAAHPELQVLIVGLTLAFFVLHKAKPLALTLRSTRAPNH